MKIIRWILVLPVAFLAAMLFKQIQTLAYWLHPAMWLFIALSLLAAYLSSLFFVYWGTATAPRNRALVGVILLILDVILIALSLGLDIYNDETTKMTIAEQVVAFFGSLSGYRAVASNVRSGFWI